MIRRIAPLVASIFGLAGWLALAPVATAHGTAMASALARPAPLPIPVTTRLPDGKRIHVLAPGPKGITFPFSKLPLGGRFQEPATITNFSGRTALAFLVGTARDSAGKLFNVEVDVRAFRGTYVAADGVSRAGVFGFI